MRLIITEKPSVARNLAESLEPGNYSKEEGFLKGEKYTYSWAIGHLVTLSDAKTYCDDPWKLSNIPIVPDVFKLVPQKNTNKQFQVLKRLIAKSKEIINASDAGREGELIFRYIMELCPTSADLKRLWISSYTEEAIQQGFNNLKTSAAYDNLYYSGKARSEADWLFGINATIALTKTINNGNVFSLGRVQTPTFALICQRFIENTSFKAVPYYIPELILNFKDIDFKAIYDGEQILKKDDAQSIITDFPEFISCTVSEKEKKNVNPPLCFDLTALQIKANNTFGFTADKTLKLTQELYEKDKALSYPRTDSRYLGEDQISDTQSLLNEFIKQDDNKADYLLEDISKSKAFNSKKITDHHAIIPTKSKVNTAQWADDKTKVYQLVLAQFFMAFGQTAIAEHIHYEFKHQDHVFKTSEKIYDFVGWKFFDNSSEKKSALPHIEIDEQIKVANTLVSDKKTSPKPLYTDASLLQAMSSAGKDFDTDELPPDIKRKGIGTPATRASVIETLIKREYIKRDKKTIIPSTNGVQLYSVIKEFTIAHVQLTGDWEEQLYLIEEGKTAYTDFMNTVKQDLNEKVLKDIKDIKTTSFASKNDIDANCPKCKRKINSNSKAYYCSDRDNCDFVLWKEVAHKKLSEKEVLSLLDLNITLVKNLKNKDNKAFDHLLVIDRNENFKLKFHKIDTATNYKCPCCTKEIKDRGNFFACSDTVDCGFTLGKTIAKKTLSNRDIEDIFIKKATGEIKGFKSKAGKLFNASLMIKEKSISFVFK